MTALSRPGCWCPPAPRPADLLPPRHPRAGRMAWSTVAVASLAILLAAALAATPAARAEELEPGMNTAGVIDFPTALDQKTPNVLHGSLELTDISAPVVLPVNARYGRQFGNLQLLADIKWRTEPVREFDYGEAKAKLRVVSLEAQRTYFAIGALGRWTDQKSKDETSLDNKPYSLLGVVTTELYPFDEWGAFLLNFYVDNRFADAGLKVQLYEGIKFVTELDYHHGDVNDLGQKWRTKAGFEFESEQNFYFQILYDDAGNHARIQLGTGF
jgi:hypothetical protein